MAEVFVARQPIFNRTLQVAGYELLFRDGDATHALIADPEGATASVVLNSFTEIGLERLVGPKPAWVNVSREFVLSGLAGTLPPSVVGLEILEDELLDERFVHALIELKRQGYRLALDDFEYTRQRRAAARARGRGQARPARDGTRPHVPRGRPPAALRRDAARREGRDATRTTRGAPSRAATCSRASSSASPSSCTTAGIVANRASVLDVVAALQDPTVQLAQLERKISRDVALSFRLLRYINSAFFGLRFEISSIGQALALLGVENLRRWATLTVLASIDGKPPELTVTALVRARFCELAGEQLPGPRPGELFTLGLFSVIDALMDAPIEDVVGMIPFPSDMREALVSRAGDKGSLLACVTALEGGDFDRAQKLVRGAGDLYLEALMWANDAAGPLFGQASTPARRPNAA